MSTNVESETKVSSKQFKMGSQAYLIALYRLHLKDRKYAIFGIFMIFIAAIGLLQLNDLRWLVIFFMILLIVLPMVVCFLYYYYGLEEWALFNSQNHSLTINKNGVGVTIYYRAINSQNEEESSEKINEQQGETSDINERSFVIPKKAFKEHEIWGNALFVRLMNKNKVLKGFIWIPVEAFEGVEEFKEFCNKL